MSNKHLTLLLAAPILAIGCSRMPDSEGSPQSRPISVEITTRTDIGIESRTALGDDGISVRWSTGDRIALWALDTEGSALFEAQPFELRHYNATYDEARFTGTVNSMAEGRYTYCAVSPQPATHDGTRVTYEIPAEQNGAFDGSLDIMAAEPVADAPALVEGLNGNLSLRFRHQIHLLRIRIPGNQLGEPVTRLTLKFPVPVAGTMSFDITDADAAPTISGSNQITLRFDQPKDVGDVVYAVIAPVVLEETDQIEIMATGELYESEPRTMPGKNFQAGHVTPIAYTVPEAGGPAGTIIRFRLNDTGVNTLGEAVKKLWFAAEGITLDEGSEAKPFTVNDKGEYELVFPNDSEIPTRLQEAGALTVYYDSEHATVSKSCTLGTLAIPGVNDITLPDVPYLFEEDFSGASNHDYSNSTDELSGIGLPGWGASRYEIQSGRAACYMYVGTNTSSIDNRRGRLDTPFFPLKEGASVSIKVSYNIGAPVVSGTLSSQWSVTCEFGTQVGTEGAISGDTGMTQVIERFTPTNGGDFTNPLPQSKTGILLTDATSATRLTWRAADYQKMSGSWFSTITAKYFYIYIDDIKVSIANQ